MKKITILTSILALAACGGVSGGNGPIPPSTTISEPETPNITVPAGAQNSNRAITSMKSEILVPNNSGTHSMTGRSSTTHINGKDYTSYRLDDVKFEQSGFDGDSTDETYLKFGLDENGKIIRLDVFNGDESRTQTITRDSDDAKTFSETSKKYTINYGDNASYEINTSMDTNLDDDLEFILTKENNPDKDAILAAYKDKKYTTADVKITTTSDMYGKTLSKPLSYADFGYVTQVYGNDTNGVHTVITGGYEIKAIAEENFASTDMTFTGTAIGAISAETSDGYDSKRIKTENGTATLTFQDGKETLTMPFDDYYTVTATRARGESDPTLEFTDYKGTDDKFKFNETTLNNRENTRLHFRTGYYGNNNNPTEAIGTISVEQNNNGARIGFDAAFGGTR